MQSPTHCASHSHVLLLLLLHHRLFVWQMLLGAVYLMDRRFLRAPRTRHTPRGRAARGWRHGTQRWLWLDCDRFLLSIGATGEGCAMCDVRSVDAAGAGTPAHPHTRTPASHPLRTRFAPVLFGCSLFPLLPRRRRRRCLRRRRRPQPRHRLHLPHLAAQVHRRARAPGGGRPRAHAVAGHEGAVGPPANRRKVRHRTRRAGATSTADSCHLILSTWQQNPAPLAGPVPLLSYIDILEAQPVSIFNL